MHLDNFDCIGLWIGVIASRVRSLLFDLSELSFVGLTENGLSPVRLDGYVGKEVVVNGPS